MVVVEALRVISQAAREGRVEFSEHALVDSMPDDGVFVADVIHLLLNPVDATAQDDVGRKWKVHGYLISGDPYVVVTRIRGADVVIVVTCHPPP